MRICHSTPSGDHHRSFYSSIGQHFAYVENRVAWELLDEKFKGSLPKPYTYPAVVSVDRVKDVSMVAHYLTLEDIKEVMSLFRHEMVPVPDAPASPTSKSDRFNGSDYDHNRDKDRLSSQLERVYNAMQDGCWRTLGDIGALTNDPPASVSAQLRHLRKTRHGGHTVNKKYTQRGLWHYQLILNTTERSKDT